jgi:phosphatidylglycerophosphatase A
MKGGWLETIRVASITVGGTGFVPFASGTWGSLGAMVPFVALWYIATPYLPRGVFDLLIGVGILKACVFSVVWGDWAIARFGRKDPKPFVLDEFAGQWVALLALPLAPTADWFAVACVLGGQFFLFRLFDVVKPPPARQLEALPSGWGILLDDLFAGLYANLVGQVLWRLTPLPVTLGLVGVPR